MDREAHACSLSHQLSRNRASAVPPKLFHLPTGNPGYQILLKGGWDGERGLGKHNNGVLNPIKTRIKNDRLGLGIAPLCPARVSHVASDYQTRPNLHQRTIPRNLESLDIFSALEALRTTPEQRYGITKKHRTLLLRRDRLKGNLLFRELYR